MRPIQTIAWVPDRPGCPLPGRIRMVDQTRLPGTLRYLDTNDVRAVWKAIRTLQVRGAPAIGIAAAMGVVAAVQACRAATGPDLRRAVARAAAFLATARPTAVNLFWSLDRMTACAARGAALSPDRLKHRLAREALAIWREDLATGRAIGRHGARLLRDGETILTHCNAGGLATARYGTALAPIYLAREQGKRLRVFADETRPLLQGARLTAWELMRAGVDVTLICDNMAAQVMKEGRVHRVLVGADRIAANGDSANKIGTYGLAVLARAHHVPFYVLAPTSTFDPTLATGAGIPIEQRGADEITRGFGARTAPEGVKVYAPAFDVTPARLITAIVCEHGVLRPPFDRAIRRALAAGRPRDDLAKRTS